MSAQKIGWAMIALSVWLATIVFDRVVPLDPIDIKWVSFALGGIHFLAVSAALATTPKGAASDV